MPESVYPESIDSFPALPDSLSGPPKHSEIHETIHSALVAIESALGVNPGNRIDAATTAANTALSTANTAKSTADSAKTTANTALNTANTAKTTADSAQTAATTATTTANTAKSTADSAKTTATTALNTANSAVTTANAATTTANQAKTTATTANTTANAAQSTADSATTAAAAAQSTANTANSLANTVNGKANANTNRFQCGFVMLDPNTQGYATLTLPSSLGSTQWNVICTVASTADVEWHVRPTGTPSSGTQILLSVWVNGVLSDVNTPIYYIAFKLD